MDLVLSMLRGTHKAFAEKIALELGFSGLNARVFIDGSLGPDSHGDFPHDYGKNAKETSCHVASCSVVECVDRELPASPTINAPPVYNYHTDSRSKVKY